MDVKCQALGVRLHFVKLHLSQKKVLLRAYAQGLGIKVLMSPNPKGQALQNHCSGGVLDTSFFEACNSS